MTQKNMHCVCSSTFYFKKVDYWEVNNIGRLWLNYADAEKSVNKPKG